MFHETYGFLLKVASFEARRCKKDQPSPSDVLISQNGNRQFPRFSGRLVSLVKESGANSGASLQQGVDLYVF